MSFMGKVSAERLPASFTWLNLTQFLGALNDNVFKLLVVFFLVDAAGAAQREAVVALSAALFVAPFLLFSQVGGVLADRYSKSSVLVWTKALEVAVMALGVGGVWIGNGPVLFATIFLMSLQSALFSPAKYGIVPEMISAGQLSRANGILVSATYLAIIIGTFIPSYLLLQVFDHNFLLLSLFCLAVAVAGWLASLRIVRTPPAGGTARMTAWFLGDIWRTLRASSRDRYLMMTILASSYFLYLGAFIQQNALVYGQDYLGMGWIESGYLFPVSALGIGLGALLCGRVSGRNIEFGIVPVGAIGLTLGCVALGLVAPSVRSALAIIFVIGLSSGLFIVPLNAFLQYRSPPDRRGEILACANFLSFLGVALSAATFFLLTRVLHMTPGAGFVVVGVLTGVLAIASVLVLPDFLVRFLIMLVTRGLYRIRAAGTDHIPVEGGALLVSNHVTWVDALVISATQQRRIRFVMARDIWKNRWLNPLFRLMGVIPISPNDPPRRIVEALQAARRCIEDGFIVCLFAEGAITRNGNLRAFRSGLERIVRGTGAPVIPVYIGGGWGSIFSYRSGRLLSSLPRRLPYPVSVIFGEPLSAASEVWQVRQAVLDLSTRSFDLLTPPGSTLGKAFVASARRHWLKTALADTTGRRLTFGGTLISAIALARVVRRVAAADGAIGILLPASVGAALVNVAVTLAGKVPVNLNFTASADALAAAAKQAGVQRTVTSDAFLKRLAGVQVPGERVRIEDLARQVTPADRAVAVLAALFLPARWLCPRAERRRSATATVMFSSGSTGVPKGVVLTHRNILANIDAFTQVVNFRGSDAMCAVLPLFHSFGFTCTLWCPLTSGLAVHYHPNPLDAGGIAQMVRDRGLTAMLATPTFLGMYMRRAEPADFRSLRIVITGAEKLRAELAEAFEARFGVRPREGYGTTELSPAVAVSLPDAEVAGVRQAGSKPGSVGHPVPGVSVRVVDLQTGAPVPPGRDGLLLVKGPNVMEGYLNDPERTREAVKEGWYNTGDVAHVDDDGFIFLVDRLSRFSKIGGEMVPHVAVEEAISRAVGAMDQAVVVTAVEEERRGEQLVVLFTPAAGSADRLRAAVESSSLPNLWRPRRECYFEIDTVPHLGTGKTDIRSVRALAVERVRARMAEKGGAS